MLPSEMIILLAIVVDRKTGAKLRNRPMDVTSEYIGYLYDSLVNRGYLKQRSGRVYQLTEMGRLALSDSIRNNKARASEFAGRLKLLGIRITPEQKQKIRELEKEAAKTRSK